MLDWVYMAILGLQESSPFTAVTTNTKLRFGGRQSTLALFTRWPKEDSFPLSRALGGKCPRLSRFWFISRLQGVRVCGVFVKGNSNYRLNTKSYSHISFLNTRGNSSEFLPVQDSIEYSIT